MIKIDVETKNGGTIEVVKFDSLTEATTELGAVEALVFINRQVRTKAVNEANTKQSLLAKLKAAVKSGKITQDELDDKIAGLLADL